MYNRIPLHLNFRPHKANLWPRRSWNLKSCQEGAVVVFPDLSRVCLMYCQQPWNKLSFLFFHNLSHYKKGKLNTETTLPFGMLPYSLNVTFLYLFDQHYPGGWRQPTLHHPDVATQETVCGVCDKDFFNCHKANLLATWFAEACGFLGRSTSTLRDASGFVNIRDPVRPSVGCDNILLIFVGSHRFGYKLRSVLSRCLGKA